MDVPPVCYVIEQNHRQYAWMDQQSAGYIPPAIGGPVPASGRGVSSPAPRRPGHPTMMATASAGSARCAETHWSRGTSSGVPDARDPPPDVLHPPDGFALAAKRPAGEGFKCSASPDSVLSSGIAGYSLVVFIRRSLATSACLAVGAVTPVRHRQLASCALSVVDNHIVIWRAVSHLGEDMASIVSTN